MRLILVLGTLIAALTVAGVSSARPSAWSTCERDFHHGGSHYLAVGKGVGCVQTMLIVNKLVSEPIIGHVTRGSVTILKIRSPLVGWACDAIGGKRSKGAGCHKGALSAFYWKLSK